MKSVYNRLEKTEAGFTENGHLLEEQLIGTINSRLYKQLAYTYLHREEIEGDGLDITAKYERTLIAREKSESSFVTVMDFKKTEIPLNIAMNLVEKCQTENPEAPKKIFSRKLLEGVKGGFEDKYIFKFFTASGGTHLDICNGIDGYFKLYDKETKKRLATATIDLTSNPNKINTPADLLIYISKEDTFRLDNSRGNEKFDPAFLDELISKEKVRVINTLVNSFLERKEKNKI